MQERLEIRKVIGFIRSGHESEEGHKMGSVLLVNDICFSLLLASTSISTATVTYLILAMVHVIHSPTSAVILVPKLYVQR